MLAIIGPNWIDAADKIGSRRLNDPEDFVRIEVAAALERNIPVIPILIDGADVPTTAQLPEEIAELSVRNGIAIRGMSFHNDIDKLVRDISGYTEKSCVVGTTKLRDEVPKLTAAWAMAERGRWMRSIVDIKSRSPPSFFRDYFIVLQGNNHVSPGAIVKGQTWDQTTKPGWEPVHAYFWGSPIVYVRMNEMTYLGSEWRAEYATLSDEVYVWMKGRPLSKRVTRT